MTNEIGYSLAFATGLFGALHCLGMCSGLAAGFFVYQGWTRKISPLLAYHGSRVLVYAVFGVASAALGRVLVQTGVLGKGQGILMMVAGALIMLIGLRLAGLVFWLAGKGNRDRQVAIPIPTLRLPQRRWLPVAAGIVNGLVPCSLVFSVAVKAAATADPLRAGLLMAAFGLGTLPTMAAVSFLGAYVGRNARGIFARLAGLVVIALGIWTLYEGVVFFDIMRGLADW